MERSCIMSDVVAESSVGQLVSQRPGRARIFDGFGIDYCCGGGKSLAEACRAKKLDLQTVVAVLRAFDDQAAAPPDERDWTKASLTELCDHIEQSHHTYLAQELPRLEQCLRKIASRHGPSNSRLVELL